jgi:hypothetical protein
MEARKLVCNAYADGRWYSKFLEYATGSMGFQHSKIIANYREINIGRIENLLLKIDKNELIRISKEFNLTDSDRKILKIMREYEDLKSGMVFNDDRTESRQRYEIVNVILTEKQPQK